MRESEQELGRVAIVMSTALVSAIQCEERTAQFLYGFQQWLQRFPGRHFIWVDNTISSLEGLDERFEDIESRIGSGNVFFFDDNSLGRVNKGAGLLIQMKTLFSSGILEQFDWILFFEPRQRVVAWTRIDTLLRSPEGAFWIESAKKLRYVVRGRKFPPNFYTGIFVLSVPHFKAFVEENSPECLFAGGHSVEKVLYDYVHSAGIPFRKLRSIGVRRTLPGGAKEYR